MYKVKLKWSSKTWTFNIERATSKSDAAQQALSQLYAQYPLAQHAVGIGIEVTHEKA